MSDDYEHGRLYVYDATSQTFDLAAVTDEMINAAAREMWNDRDARMGGPWDGRSPDEVCVVQTKATARAALTAALSRGAGDAT